jgi:hypothetical protein
MIKVFPISIVARIAGAVLTAIVLVSVVSTAYAKKAIPPTLEDLIGVWIGFDDDELVFSRLDLRSDFTGYLARVSPSDTILHDYGVSAYRVTKWTVDDWNFGISLTATTSKAESIQMRGRYNGFSLRLKISGTNGLWERNVILNREVRETAANRETGEKIQELEKRKP